MIFLVVVSIHTFIIKDLRLCHTRPCLSLSRNPWFKKFKILLSVNYKKVSIFKWIRYIWSGILFNKNTQLVDVLRCNLFNVYVKYSYFLIIELVGRTEMLHNCLVLKYCQVFYSILKITQHFEKRPLKNTFAIRRIAART